MQHLIRLLAACAIAIGGYWLWTTTHTATTVGLKGVDESLQFAHRSDGPLPPNVITTATKLSQGQRAVPGMATDPSLALPTLRVTEAGRALMIPGGALPGTQRYQQLAPLPPPGTGAARQLRFDMYSWSEGTLYSTTTDWLSMQDNDLMAQLPVPLVEIASSREISERFMLLLPPGDSTTAPLYNPSDAYLVVAEVLTPN